MAQETHQHGHIKYVCGGLLYEVLQKTLRIVSSPNWPLCQFGLLVTMSFCVWHCGRFVVNDNFLILAGDDATFVSSSYPLIYAKKINTL